MEPLLPPRPAHPLGCHNPPVTDQDAMNATLLVLHTGMQWNALNATAICSSSFAHGRFSERTEADVFQEFWRKAFAYDELDGIKWRDGSAPSRKALSLRREQLLQVLVVQHA